MAYKLINVKEYSQTIKKQYFECPDLWYKSILPREAANHFKEKCKGDFSLIWHEHCLECWKSIETSSTDEAYYDEEKNTWLCKDCYKRIILKAETDNENK